MRVYTFFCKFAHDTYLIFPASNQAYRDIKLTIMQHWGQRNNLTLKCGKWCDVFRDCRRRRHVMQPAPLPGIERSRNLKILGVDIGHDFSVTQYVQRLASGDLLRKRCMCCVLRAQGLNNLALQARLSDCHYCKNDVCCQCLAWIHQGFKPIA